MCAKGRKTKCRRKKPEWKYIDRYDVLEYRCGLRAGDHVRLRRDLPIRDWQGNLTGEIHPAGETWRVLPGATDDPGIVFLLQPDGRRHTWDDNPVIYEWFERIEPADANLGNDTMQV